VYSEKLKAEGLTPDIQRAKNVHSLHNAGHGICEIFARAVLHSNPGLARNPDQLRAAVAQAAQRNGWQVQ